MSSASSFGVNGRFLTQPITGVQRYARNIVAAMNESLASSKDHAPIVAPLSAEDLGLATMPLVKRGPLSGQLWEQMVLPALWHGRLLNLCNLAPAIKTDQVVCIHDANIFVAPESYDSSFRAVYGTLQRLITQRSARVATVSVDSARQIAHYLSIPAKDIPVLPNGHEHALNWNPLLARIAPSVIDTRRPFVLALGSRARHKNMQLLFDLAPDLAAMGLDVIIAGGGAGIFATEALPKIPNVKVIGYVSDHDLAYLMERALCLAFPSWTEGFGLPIVEAMARGCPVISSDRASMPEVCGDAALMAAPDDAVAWAQHVHALVNSADLRFELIGRGREQVRQFSWTKTADGYVELMREPTMKLKRRAQSEPISEPDNLVQCKSKKEPLDLLHRTGEPTLSLAVVVATLGRPDIVTATLKHLLETQTLQPAAVIVSCVSSTDAGEAANIPNVTVVTGPPGLPTQRNTALKALPPGIDCVVFFDDDFVAEAGWLAAAAQAFQEEAQIVGFTGRVLADGIKGPGLSFEEAVRIVQSDHFASPWSRIEPYSPYGCNMAFRVAAIGNLKFDERLVLYGWLEDRDFGAALAKRGGRLIKCANARGVHMGVKSGRVAGDRLGYSQVVNPLYLFRKGTMSLGQVASHLFRNIASNVARAASPEPFIDRRGRLRGNLRGLFDVLRGRFDPDRAAAIRPATKR